MVGKDAISVRLVMCCSLGKDAISVRLVICCLLRTDAISVCLVMCRLSPLLEFPLLLTNKLLQFVKFCMVLGLDSFAILGLMFFAKK